MSCSTEINACPQTVSDQCVRYTGPNIPSLGITTGVTLSVVEDKIFDYLTPLLTGVGDAITIAPVDTCTLITQFLTGITTPNSTQLFRALSKAICSLQTQTTANTSALNSLNSDYAIGCLTGVTASSDTHDIVQAVISRLCTTIADLDAVEVDLATNYVKLSEVNALIAAYLASNTPTVTQQYQKMIPFTVMEYYGPLTNFDSTGKGLVAQGFDKIYLCNGSNGTPDKRGRVAVGAISGVPGGALDANVDPAFAGNPNYALNDVSGTNTITLTPTQIPSHSHTPTTNTVVTENPHQHFIASPGTTSGAGAPDLNSSGTAQVSFNDGGTYNTRLVNSTTAPANVGKTNSVSTGVTVSTTVAIGNTGGGGAHANIQPVRACYYIMYIP